MASVVNLVDRPLSPVNDTERPPSVQHDGRDAARRADSSAIAEPCYTCTYKRAGGQTHQ